MNRSSLAHIQRNLLTPVERVTVIIPLPPSTNALFANVPRKGRVKTQRYRDWIEEAGWRIALQKPGRIDGKYEIDIEVSTDYLGDIDNIAKPTSDLMQSYGIIENDKLAQRFQIRRVEGVLGARIVVVKAKEGSK